MFRKVVAVLSILSLFAIPVIASDSSMGEGSSNEDYEEIVEGGLDAENNEDNGQASQISVDLSTVEGNQETINNNIVFLTSCVMAMGGVFVGYWTGKDLLDFLW